MDAPLSVLDFSGGLVLDAFLLESGFIALLNLIIGAIPALWSAWKIVSTLAPDFLIPIVITAQ